MRLKRRIKNPIVRVLWGDAHANGAWQETPEHTPALCESEGRVWKYDESGITLYSSKSADASRAWGNTQFIPEGMIIKITPPIQRKHK